MVAKGKLIAGKLIAGNPIAADQSAQHSRCGAGRASLAVGIYSIKVFYSE